MTIFGPIISGGDVEDWTLDELRKWSCTYLSEMERQHGIKVGSLSQVRSWVIAPIFAKWPEDQLPCICILSTGMIGEPVREGDGTYRATWSIDVGAVCHARTERMARRLARLYTAAHRELILERPSLGGHAAGVRQLGEVYTDMSFDDQRSINSGRARFAIEVRGIGRGPAGPLASAEPLVPCEQDWPPWPDFDRVEIELEHIPPPEELPKEAR